MCQRVEGAAIEQAGLDIVELPFDFALGLRAAHAAGLGAEAIVRGEGEELGIVQRAVGVTPEHHGLEVVVQADARHAAQVMKRPHMLALGRHQVHRLDKAQILPARVAEQVAEAVHASPAFAREVDVVDAIVHLGLHSFRGLKARHRLQRGTRTEKPHSLAHHRIAAGVAAGTQLLQGTLDGEVRIFGEQFLQDRLEGIDLAAALTRSG